MDIKFSSDDLIDLSESARILRISRPTLYKLIEQGKLIPIRLGRGRYLPRYQIEELRSAKP